METNSIETWLYSVLAGDATLHGYVADRIYMHLAPAGTSWPCILVTLQEYPDDLMVVNAKRVWSEAMYIVRAVGPYEGFGTLNTIADRIDALLHRQSGTNVHACIREEIFLMVEVVDDVQYRHLGGIYKIYGN